MKELFQTFINIDWSFIVPYLPFLGLPISAYLGYVFAIRSKKKDIAKEACNEIRDEAWQMLKTITEYWSCCLTQKCYSVNKSGEKEPLNTLVGYMGDYPNDALCKVKNILNRANDALSSRDRKVILNNFKKIISFYQKIKNIKPTTEFPDNYYKKLLKYISKIKRY